MNKELHILFFGNNKVGFEVLKFLKERGENIIGLVLHPDIKAKFKTEMISLFPRDINIINAEQLKDTSIIKQIQDLNPDMFISVYFGYILSQELLKIPKKKAINLHPAYLPYNRGTNPNVWSIIDGTPAGVSIHYMDEGIDTGNIIAREQVETDFSDTGKTLYEKLEISAINLFKKKWQDIKEVKISIIKPKEKGTIHYIKDFYLIDEIDLNKKYTPIELINILRARTYPPYKGSFFQINGKKYYIEIKILKET